MTQTSLCKKKQKKRREKGQPKPVRKRIQPNQLHARDERGMYQGRKGRHQLFIDLYEAYQLYDSPNGAQVIDFLFMWENNDTERVITGFQMMRRLGVVLAK